MTETVPTLADPVIRVSAPSPSPVLPTNHKFMMIAIVVIGGLLTLGIGGMILIANSNMGSEANNVPQNQTPAPAPVPVASQPTPVPPPAPAADKTTIDDNANSVTFTSEELGITFAVKHMENGVENTIVRDGTKVYVNSGFADYHSGQSLEVFTKDADTSLEDAIKSKFLNGYDPAQCFVGTGGLGFSGAAFPGGYIAKSIQYPASDDMESAYANASNCPAGYTASNGIAAFYGTTTPNKHYLYVSIGQYAIDGPTGNTWQETIRFL